MPVGTNSHLHQLKRMVLKDIKNDPSGNSGLKRPSGSLKRRISEPAGQSLLQCESRLGKGNMEKEKDCGLSSAARERNKNIYTDIPNPPLTLQDKKRTEGVLCETEISLQSVSIETDGIASPAFRNEMSPRSHEGLLSSPDSYSACSILSKKNEQELAEFSTINSDKFFSTPMPSKERVRKKLTPVMETEAESSISEECQEKVSPTDSVHEVVSHESPTQTPLYRSFFATECQEIAKQIKGIKTDGRKSPGKRKSEELDVSSIDAEPPPYDCTPMKSMLACEVAKMFSSMESSPTKEGLSFFGESILDLEKTDMQISYFNSPKCDIESNKRHSVSGTEWLSLNDSAYTIQPKRQKTEPLGKLDWGVNVNLVNKMSPLPIVDCSTSEAPTVESLYISATSKCGEGITAVFSNSVILPEQKLVEPAFLMQDTVVSPLASDRSTSISPVHEGPTVTPIKHLFQTGGHKLCTNTAQDNVLNYDELPPAEESNTKPMQEEMTRVPHAFNTTQDIQVIQEVKKMNTTQVIEMVGMPSGSTTQDIAPAHNDPISGNTIQVMDVAPLSANTTQDVAPACDTVSSNTTQVIDVAPLPANTTQDFSPVHDDATSSNTTQDVSSVRDDATSSNTTQVMDVVTMSANTTQDVSPVHDDATSSNTTQVIDVVPPSANTTQDISSVRDATSSNTTQVIDVVPLSTNTTQDVLPVHDDALSSNTTQIIDVIPLSTNTTRDVLPVHDDATSSNTTQVIDDVPMSTNTTQDVLPVHDDATSSNTTQVIDVVPLSTNTTQDVLPVHDDATSVNTTQVVDVAPLSTNTTQDIAPVHIDATSANTTQVMDVANTTQDVAPVHVISQIMDVAPLSTNTTQDITPIREVGITANTTPMIELELKIPVNNTVDIPSMHESKTSNTTYGTEMEMQPCITTSKTIASVHDTLSSDCKNQVNEIVLQGSANRVLGATSSSDEITTQDIGAMQKSMGVLPADEAIHTPHTDAVSEPLCTAGLSHDEIMSANHDRLLKDVTHTSLSMAFNVSSQHSVGICDLNLPGATGKNMHICASNSKAENKENQVVSNNPKNVSKLGPTQETSVVNDLEELPSVEPEAITSHSDLGCVTPEFSPPAQVKPNVTEGRNIRGHEKSCTASSQKEVDICRDSGNPPLLSESCSMIQEEDSAHDVSVFSVGSLSFITSTPVPGLNNFPFQNSCRDSVKQDPNVSIGMVLDDSSNKVLGEQRMIPQRSHGANRLDCKDKQETSRLSFLPPNMQKRMVPPSEAGPKQMPSTSGIPSARRSLALHQNASHNTAREMACSKIAPKSGIPGRSMIRPPLARQNMTRATLVNTKQGMESTGGSGITNKLAENRLRTPSAAVVKAKSVTAHSQLPTAPSAIKPPSRIGAPGTMGRPSIGVQNSAPDLQDTPKVDAVSAVHPPMSTGIRTGPLRPGTSSVRPPLQQLQKASLKPKSQVQGLPTKRTPRELPTLGCRKEGSSKAESTSVVRSSTKQTTFALDATKQAASFQAEMAEGKPETCPHLEMSKCCQLMKAFEEFKRHYELAKSEHERCQQLEMCTCCRLLKMSTFEDFQRLFGPAEKTNIADT